MYPCINYLSKSKTKLILNDSGLGCKLNQTCNCKKCPAGGALVQICGLRDIPLASRGTSIVAQAWPITVDTQWPY